LKQVLEEWFHAARGSTPTGYDALRHVSAGNEEVLRGRRSRDGESGVFGKKLASEGKLCLQTF